MSNVKSDMKPKTFLILAIIALILYVSLLCLTLYTTFFKQPPNNLSSLSCTFSSYQIEKHTRSSTTDLILLSPDHEKKFEISFYNSCDEYLPKLDLLCSGELFSLQVSEHKNMFSIHGLADSKGMVYLTPESKNEAVQKSQMPLAIFMLAFSTISIIFFAVGIPVHYHPERFHPIIRKLYFYKKKSI